MCSGSVSLPVLPLYLVILLPLLAGLAYPLTRESNARMLELSAMHVETARRVELRMQEEQLSTQLMTLAVDGVRKLYNGRWNGWHIITCRIRNI